MYGTNLDCKLKDYENLIAIKKWDPKKDSLFVQEKKLNYKILPSIAPKSYDTDTIRKVTETVLAMLEMLHTLVTNSRKVLLGHADGDLINSNETIQIYIDFWENTNIEKLQKIKTDAELEDKASWGSRPEVAKLRTIMAKLIDDKELPVACTFNAHVGRNTSGLIVSETVFRDRASLGEKHIFRIAGSPYNSNTSYYSYGYREQGCLTASLVFELYFDSYQASRDEVTMEGSIKKGQPVMKLNGYFPSCNDKGVSHRCPAARAENIFKQVFVEISPSQFVANNKDTMTKVKSLLSERDIDMNQLTRPHPYFAAGNS